MLSVEDLSSSMKTRLLNEYNLYIQEANEDNRYQEGWYPVCVNEFLNNEFMELMEEQGFHVYNKNKK